MAIYYDNRFFDWVDQTAAQSARALLPIVLEMVDAESVVDVGCGRGTWLAAWAELGVSEIQGLDGDYVDRDRLAIDPSQFEATNLANTDPRTDRYDVAQSLEVAEHLPAGSAAGFVDLLCGLADVVLFSAAQPGQGGEDHVNEQPLSYWADLFAKNDFQPFDCIRPRVEQDGDVAAWYRYNTLIYANEAGRARLSQAALNARVSHPEAISSGGSLRWNVRRMVLRPLPVGVVTWLSRMNYSVQRALHRR